MRLTNVAAVIAVALIVPPARAQEPPEPPKSIDPLDSRPSPLALRIAPAPPEHHVAHVELGAGVALAATGASRAILGGSLAGARDDFGPDGGDRAWRAGIGLGVIGAAAFLPGVVLLLHGGARERALRRYALDGDVRDLTARLDLDDAHARRNESVAMGFFFGGLALSVGGIIMAAASLPGISFDDNGSGGGGGNGALLLSGMVISCLGDAGVFGGWIAWSWASGTRAGIRDVRGSLRLAPTGIAGRF